MAELSQPALRKFVDEIWNAEIVPTLVEYIAIPNKSPSFEPNWEKLGHMEKAVELFVAWAAQKLPALGATLSVERLPGRTPLIFIDVPGSARDGDTVLLYGHLDKQPEMTGWAEGKGPWIPVIEGDKLYGRGGADDGYAMFGALGALLALKEQGVPHARAVVVIEASEESGSPDLPIYMDALAERIGDVSLVVCLDSGCGDYDRLWLTTSLRGMVGGTLRVDVLEEGVHSGDASGVVPSSFRVMRQLLARVEDIETGAIKGDAFNAKIPEERQRQAKVAAQALGDQVYAKFPFVDGMKPNGAELDQLVLNRTWRPALSITGFAGAPEPVNAGNVLRPFTEAKLSLRVPPTTDAKKASAELKRILETDPPYGAKVSYAGEKDGSGWNAPATAPWLEAALEDASHASFGKPVAMMGEGGSIPFMGMLGEKFPRAQFVVTGVLGPHSNAHGPNEFLHIPTGKRVTEVVARVLAAHAVR
ncbi:M20 family metallopeptidase [Terricaulis sp.]|uniref:M20 family metallopeptidase n=1 Tax=Terricaulis sp. TaxID=2768686 RepID=UPI002AC44944|nr:M20 family metallopeptidase [Terricaulis sp.]MDZ4689763.1 M20 family metallopeptidase [Terricaulis sp.]